MTDPLEGLAVDLETQRRYLADQVPAYARLLELLPGVLNGAGRERLTTAWDSREFGAFYERPLLLLASLRDEALLEGPTHPLWKAIGAGEPDPGSVSDAAIGSALERERFWELVATRHVQTNETSRAVAWLWPAALLARNAPGTSVAILDIGASAGLNLVADRLGPIWADEAGDPLELSPIAPVSRRTGFDLRPLEVLDPDVQRWLRACVWPGQDDRLTRLDQAIAAFTSLAEAGQAPVLTALSASQVPGTLPTGGDEFALAYQTVVRDYLPDDERTRFEDGMLDWLGRRSAGGAAWIQLELEAGTEVAKPFALTARVAGAEEGEPMVLARCDPHPRVMLVDEGAVQRFVKAAA